MAVPLEALITCDPSVSAIFTAEGVPDETAGLYLFTHHALQVICDDTDMEKPDEQIRGMATAIWTGLLSRKKQFWENRAATARLLQDHGKEFLVTDASTPLSKDNREKASQAFNGYRRQGMGEFLSEDEESETEELGELAEDQEQLAGGEVSEANGSPIANPQADESPGAQAIEESPHRQERATSDVPITNASIEETTERSEKTEVAKRKPSFNVTASDFVPSQNPSESQAFVAKPPSFKATASTFVPSNGTDEQVEGSPTVEIGSTLPSGSRRNSELRADVSDFVTQQQEAPQVHRPHLFNPGAASFTFASAESVATAAVADALFDSNDSSDDSAATEAENRNMESSMSSLPAVSTPNTPLSSRLDWAEESQEHWDLEMQNRSSNVGSANRKDELPIHRESPSPTKQDRDLDWASTADKPKSAAKPSTRPENPAVGQVKKSWVGFGDINAAKQFSASATKGKGHGTAPPSLANKPKPSKPSRNSEAAKVPTVSAWSKPLVKAARQPVEPSVPVEAEAEPLESTAFQQAAEDGQNFFIWQALPIICEDLDVHKVTKYERDMALSMWNDLPRPVKKIWSEDAKLLRGGSALGHSQLFSTERFAESRFTKDYRTQIIKALAERNDGELKYLQPEYEKIVSLEKKQAYRQAKKNARVRQVYEEAQSRPGSSMSKASRATHSAAGSVSSVPAESIDNVNQPEEEHASSHNYINGQEEAASAWTTDNANATDDWAQPSQVDGGGAWDVKRKIPGVKKKKDKQSRHPKEEDSQEATPAESAPPAATHEAWQAPREVPKPKTKKKKFMLLSETDPLPPPDMAFDEDDSRPASSVGGWDDRRYVPGMKKKKGKSKGKSEADSFFDSIEQTMASVQHVAADVEGGDGWTTASRGNGKAK